jgi:hypothetical protein
VVRLCNPSLPPASPPVHLLTHFCCPQVHPQAAQAPVGTPCSRLWPGALAHTRTLLRHPARHPDHEHRPHLACSLLPPAPPPNRPGLCCMV